jgi:signal transduction histidine kinase
MNSERLKQWVNISRFLLAYVSIAFIGWAARSVMLQPYDGLNWVVPSGEVLDVDPAGPARGLLEPGVFILAVDGRPPELALPLYSGKQPGDSVEFLTEADGRLRTVQIDLISPPGHIAIQWFAIYFVAAAFWAGGVFILAHAQEAQRAIGFFAWCLTASLVLSSGALSPTGPSWVSSLWMTGPMTIHFHLIFLEKDIPHRMMLLYAHYGLSLLGALPFIIWGAGVIRASRLFDLLYIGGRLNLALGFLAAIGLLVHSHSTAQDAALRQRIQIVGLNASIALLPPVVFNLLPDALLRQQLLPYEASFVFLISIPVGYGYAIVRHQMIRLDRYFNRASTYTLIVLVMAAFYFVLIGLLRVGLPDPLASDPLIQLATVLILGASFPAIRHRMQQVVDQAFYSGWYDYRSAVERITRTLQSITDPQDLAISLSHWVRRVLRLESAATLVLGPFGTVLGTDRMETTNPSEQVEFVNADGLLPRQGILHRFLEGTSNPIEARIVRRLVPAPSLTQGERDLQHLVNGVIWVPIHGQDGLLGLVILGPRLANETFHALDMDIMKQVAQHCSAVIENLGLLHQLRARAEEVEGLNRQIVSAREKERRSLSHELHDEVIQDLVALTYRISRDPNVAAEDLRKGIREIIQTVREIIRELRPPMLDNLGLLPALRACVRDFREGSGNGIDVQFRTNCAGEEWFPDDIAITIYRVLYEALSNIRKHAQATTALVSLKRENSQMTLEIQDDGVGFDMPENLGRLVMDRHYGLVTIRERLELVDGSLEIESTIDEGTTIRASMPLPEGLTASGDEREGIRW